MLVFLLRYLQAQFVTKNVKNWMEDEADSLKGFEWREGSQRNTTGILICSEIFLYGNDTAMDTQGMFDHQSTMKDNIVIFAISTLISSVQIYNVQGQIQEDDLQHLQV